MPIGHAVRRDRFRTAVVGESGPLSLLPIDVVEYQKNAALAREGRIVSSPDQAKPSAWRCSGQASGRPAWVTSFCAVKPPGWRPSRIARVMSGARKVKRKQQRHIGGAQLFQHRKVTDASFGAPPRTSSL